MKLLIELIGFVIGVCFTWYALSDPNLNLLISMLGGGMMGWFGTDLIDRARGVRND